MKRALGICAAMAATSLAHAQSINIDFGSGASNPPSSFGAMGLVGTWNAIDLLLEPGRSSPPIALVDIQGSPTTCTLFIEDAYGTLDYPHDETSGELATLMDDALFALSPDISMSLTFVGLEPGDYRIIVYAWDFPTDSFAVAATANGVPIFPGVAGGPWTGELTVGVTHLEHTQTLSDLLELEVVGAGPGAFFNGSGVVNGIQLWKLEAPTCDADLDGTLEVDGADLGLLLASWGRRGPADLDGSGTIDGADLGLLLAAWGECPNQEPVRCGDLGLEACLDVHGTPGCDEPTCCASVCGIDVYCCSTAWDQLCVDIANLSSACVAGVHPHCGDPASGSCFISNDSLPGCQDKACCDAVCEVDFFCCTYTWDTICAEEAQQICQFQ